MIDGKFRQEVEEAPGGPFTAFEIPDGKSWVLQGARRDA